MSMQTMAVTLHVKNCKQNAYADDGRHPPCKNLLNKMPMQTLAVTLHVKSLVIIPKFPWTYPY